MGAPINPINNSTMNIMQKKVFYVLTANVFLRLIVCAVAGTILFFSFMPPTLQAEETTVVDSLDSIKKGFSPVFLLFYGSFLDDSADTTVGSDSSTINSKLTQIRLILSNIRSKIPPPIDVSDRAAPGSDPARDTVPPVGKTTIDPYANFRVRLDSLEARFRVLEARAR